VPGGAPGREQVPAREQVLARRVRLLVAATITYNVVEAAVALTAGAAASSTALVGFGLDSLIEVSSAAAVAWQFCAHTAPARQARERTALRIIAVSFFALAGYVTVEATRALAARPLSEARPCSSRWPSQGSAASCARSPDRSAARPRSLREAAQAQELFLAADLARLQGVADRAGEEMEEATIALDLLETTRAAELAAVEAARESARQAAARAAAETQAPLARRRGQLHPVGPPSVPTTWGPRVRELPGPIDDGLQQRRHPRVRTVPLVVRAGAAAAG